MPYSIRKVGSRYCLYVKTTGQKLGCHASKADAVAQQQAVEIQKHAARHVHLKGAVGEIRTAQYEGRDHVVAPIVALMEGVIWPINAPSKEFVPSDVITVAPAAWNGRPVFSNHPVNDSGQQISGNSPAVLETSIGKVFNAHTDGKRLLLEAWIDPAKCEALGGSALETLNRIKAGEIVEVSVGTFVVTNDQPGKYLGQSYDTSWAEMFPDHLALLPLGEEGACSVAMGCGVRAAHTHTVTDTGLRIEEVPVAARSIIQRAIEFLRVSDQQETPEIKALADAVRAVEPEAKAIEDHEDHVVYAVAKANEDPRHLQRAYTKDEQGAIKLSENVVEVVPVVSYEPAALVDNKGARHSAKDMAVIQSMHDHAVELGAQCAPKAMSGGAKPCGCQDKEHLMIKDQKARDAKAAKITAAAAKLPEKVKALFDALAKKSSGDLLKAVIDQVIANKDLPFTEDDRSWLEEADEQRLLAFAGFKAGDDKAPAADDGSGDGSGDGTTDSQGKNKPNTPTVPGHTDDPSATGSYSKSKEGKVQTVQEYLKTAPPEVADIVNRQLAADKTRKAELVKALAAGQTEYSETELEAMTLPQLERTLRACKVADPRAAAAIDFSGRGGAREDGQAPAAAPAPIDMTARLRERAAARKVR